MNLATRFIFVFFLLLVSCSTLANEASDKKIIPVEFYKPYIENINAGKNIKKKRALVYITGKTEPGARVYISTKKITLLNSKNKVVYLSTKKALIGKRVKRANKNGFFKMAIRAPFYKIQLPIKLIDKNKKFKSHVYQLSFKVNRTEVKLSGNKSLEESPFMKDKASAWFGLGMNYLKYKQQSTHTGADLTLNTFKLPSIYSQFSYQINRDWSAVLSYNNSPGAVDSADDNLALGSKKTYNWQIFIIEAGFNPNKWVFNHFDGAARLNLISGIQHHIVPFLVSTATAQNELEIKTNGLTMLTFGGNYTLKKNDWNYEVFMRYQIPLASGSLFDIQSKLAFDGSVGLYRRIKNRWKIGAFWYGQWHNYSYTHNDVYIKNNPGSISNPITGNQELFFSNIEARIGYSW